MTDDLSKLSREDITKLEKAITEARDLTARQEEIIKKVFDGETKIGELRISYLDKFLDAYSTGLDDIIARKTSKLDDAFLIMEKRLAESFKSVDSESKRKKKVDKSASSGKIVKSAHKNTPKTQQQEAPKPRKEKESEVPTKKPEAKAKKPKADVKLSGDGVQQITPGSKRDELGDDAEKIKFTEMSVEELMEFFQKSIDERQDAIEKALDDDEDTGKKALIQKTELESRSREQELEALKNQAKLKESIFNNMLDLEIAMCQEEEALQNRAAEHKLTQLQEVTSAELELQKQMNAYNTALTYAGAPNRDEQDHEYNEAGELRARLVNTKDMENAIKELDAKRIKWIEKQELEAKRKNNGLLKKEDATRIQQEAALRFKLESENQEKLGKRRMAMEADRAHAEERNLLFTETHTLFTSKSFQERKNAFFNLTQNDDGSVDKESIGKTISAALYTLSDIAKQLEKKIDNIASYKSFIDTRLQGSSNEQYSGSYWDQLVRDMTSVGAINPYFKQEDFANNIKTLVDRGISFDLKQRAFLMTIQEKIANTFDVADGTLLRLVRIQQEDSTAGRLGMESALNTFLNNMYENTEYLKTVADGVRGSLEEMQALMQGEEATEVEYQVQKWLGSLYSVGMSQNAVNSISTSLGQIAAGQIEGLTNGGSGNLLVMAANEAGLSIADILTDGLDADETNKLLQSAVNYLAELAESSSDNNVVQQQLADVFGVKASDLKAATNLAVQNSVSNIYSNSMTYNSMLSQLNAMASSMGSRTSMAEWMTNFWENGMYTLAGSMASNPVSYFIYKMASGLDSMAGGINLPFVNVLGSGVDLNTTVSDLMRVAAVSTGILGSIGPLISGLGSSFSGQAMLNKMGIGTGSGLAITPRGEGTTLNTLSGGGTQTTSESGYASYASNTSGSDIKESTIQEANNSKKQQMIEAKEEAEASQIDVLNSTVLKIYELLDDVAHGNSCFRVRVDEYGLTKASNGGNALAGVGALGGNGATSASGTFPGSGTSGSGSGSGSSSGKVSSNGILGGVTLGGWSFTS